MNAGKRRALVLEPSSALRQVLVEALGELGLEVIASDRRTEALRMLLSNPDIDLALIDLVDTAGGEVFVSTLAELSEAASLPLILMSAGRPPEGPPNAVYLAKPFDLEELLGAVRASMRAGAGSASASRDAHDPA